MGERSTDQPTAVNDEGLPGHERGLVTGEVEHSVGDVARLTGAIQECGIWRPPAQSTMY